MIINAKLRNLNSAPRKVRLVADLIRGKKTKEALAILDFAVKKSALPLKKLLMSAIANARNNFSLDENNLYISKITVDEGRKQKRWEPRARGVAYEIQKKTSHINLVLDEIQKTGKKEVSAAKTAKPEVVKDGQSAELQKDVEKPRFKAEASKISKPQAGKSSQKIFRRKSFSK